MQSLRSLLRPLSEEKVEKVTLPVKLDTVFSFKNLGSDYQKVLAEMERLSDTNAYTFSANCYKINDEYHQVNELQLISSDLNTPERKVHLENARLANGVTAFGSGPDPTIPKVLFEVCRTYITHDWSSHELPMPTVATCFLTSGVKKQHFPGPKFPMSHRLAGFGSEMNMESVSAIDEDMPIKLRAEFMPFPHFRQDLCHRIVLPGMCVSDFLSLDFRATGLVDDRLEEPFIITEVRIELQEFTSTHNHEAAFQDVRTKTLLESKPFESIMLSKRPSRISAKMYSCELPMVGPTFFANDLTRSYGLKATFKLSHDKIGKVTSTVFVELNMAQEKSERRRDEDFDYLRFSQAKEWALATMVRPGMELSEFMDFSFIVPQSYDEASHDMPMDDMKIVIEEIEITLVEEMRSFKRDRKFSLFKKSDHFPSIQWGDFEDVIDGSTSARSLRLPREILEGEVPLEIETSLDHSEYESPRAHTLHSRVKVRTGVKIHTLKWSHWLYVV
ncbi:uncharacterized protein CXQ87_002090 [Candidozyma duobushaemuli]|uniref:Uncharacterized protein n=1 Tax=Candidozyma duobushaemuli TaxID=1231522 RepID=A0A2V1A7L1_9ASCO|nr:uncharacterized protein CXQ87_002090 [[Candida] duobushaemulonis]PVH13968.1 hypothetical protein CXQ87_002090 [[Candida] duobushaemulonis]